MESRRAWIDRCLSLPNTYEDYPFEDDNWTVLRHRGNRRTFVFLFERQGNLWLNLKCEPMRAAFYREIYPAVLPAYHLNKTHWNSVVLDGTVPDEEVWEMVCHSYDLTKPKTAL